MLALAAGAYCTSANAQCGGVERWAVKTLTDGARLDTVVRASSIADESALDRPEDAWLHLTRQENESYELTITGKLIKAGTEPDKDYHLVLSSAGQTIICEIPDPDCPDVDQTPNAVLWRAARAKVDELVGRHVHGAIKDVANPPTVTLTGFGFWDRPDHGTGHSVNGREIHPVMSVVASQ